MRLEAKETFFFLCKKFYFGKFQIGMEVGWRKMHGKTSSTHYLHSAANIVLNAYSLSRLPLLQQWMDLKMNSRLHISLARYESLENQHFHLGKFLILSWHHLIYTIINCFCLSLTSMLTCMLRLESKVHMLLWFLTFLREYFLN